jgi:hypothetical protein
MSVPSITDAIGQATDEGVRRRSGYSHELMRLRGPRTQAIRTRPLRPSSRVIARRVRRTPASLRVTITAQ